MGQLKQWREQNWVRIGTDGSIKGPCGTSKDKKNPDTIKWYQSNPIIVIINNIQNTTIII